ncbi:unnamed protein product [Caenorhabditis bovis]|uniref:GH18 domain-containing protein n=1 Tax=Caenorhabditis bovis TaxID=2654633 RepID=A0A8S1F146_9PELO|nr:unnamed protein product [Caenorhabditis bovis]
MGTIALLLLAVLSSPISSIISPIAQKEEASSLYCFVKPPPKTVFNPRLLENITCTHFVFGEFSIDNAKGTPKFTNFDLIYAGSDGNIRNFLRLRQKHPKSKFLLGVRRSAPFTDSIQAKHVARGAKRAAVERNFDGIFFEFNGYHLETSSSAVFIKEISMGNGTMNTIGISARRVWQRDSVERIRQTINYVENVYVDMSTLPSNEDPLIITHIDPLWANGTVVYEDTIQGTVDKLSENGVMPNKVVVGFTAGGWMFEVPNVLRINHGDFATSEGKRIPYQDTCKTRGTIVFDNQTLDEVTLYRNTWVSANVPTRQGLGKKMGWVLSEKFAGIGISNIFDDDPHSKCGADPLPLHNFAMRMIRDVIPSSPAKCTRICYLETSRIDKSFPFDSLKSEFCSHIVIDYFDIDVQDVSMVREGADLLIARIDKWRLKIGEVAPRLILSIGGHQQTTTWSLLLADDVKRNELAKDILMKVDELNADGVEISWTLESMNNEFDKNNLNSFITDINTLSKKNPVEVVVAASAASTYSNWYDVEFLNKTVDLVVLQTHRLHSNRSPFTGHPSPLRATSSMNDQKMSWEEMVKYWTKFGMARKRIAVALSAAAISMTSLADQKSFGQTGPFGQAAFVSAFRAENLDIRTQQEICESIKMESANPEWVPIAEVPYLMRNGQFVAYENVRSAHIKAVWASMQGIGITVHDVDADDPHGICDNRTAFPLLSQISRVQVCPRCVKHHDFRKCSHKFKVSCSFDLKKSVPLFKTEIVPYERCTEVVVEQAKLSNSGRIHFHDPSEEENLKCLAKMRKKMVKCGMILSLSCGTSERQFTNLLIDNMTHTIDNIMEAMKKYELSGIQLDCENVIKRNNNIQFNSFVRNLRAKLDEHLAANKCRRTLSIRFSPHTSTPNQYYQISLLNKLDHVSIAVSDHHHTDRPFFYNNTEEENYETTLLTWLQSGVKPEKMILEISPFGIRSDGGKKHTMSQGNVCETAGNRAHFVENYETLTAYHKHSTGVLSIPTINTVKYKMGFAIRENLGGISFRSVNGDDYTGICGRGSFPILKSLYSSNTCH